ncbi:MAG: class I SAM-dependent methyltransferase [Thermoplasmata archaeon]|nr:class I SAM-dependent methyltransferase [Thermoplasmata archaeon]
MTIPSRPWTRGRAMEWRLRWDAQQSFLLPEREVRFAAMLDWVESLVGRRPRCLDLGCGPGAVSERLLARFPQARSVGVDFDPVLLRLGASGLGSVAGRMTWVDADLRARGWSSSLPSGRYDAALSSTALHWLTGPQLGRFYRDLFRILRPGGVLLNADQISMPAGAKKLRAAARELRRPSSRSPPRPRSSRAEDWTEWWTAIAREPHLRGELALRARRFPHEHMGTPTPDLAGHRVRLRRAGFREVDLVWSSGESRVLAAVR